MRRLQYFNLAGVVALAALCIMQWRHDRRLNLDFNALEKKRIEQAARITEQEQNLQGLNADLTQFKEQFAKAHADLTDALAKLRTAQQQTNQLAVERDQLKNSITNWVNAVTTRDERLQDANTEIRQLTDDLNASIRKYNELATNYNTVVKDLNDLRAQIAKAQPGASGQPPPGEAERTK